MFDAISDIFKDIKIIRERIAYLETHPEEIRMTGDWDHEPYSKCTHLELLKSELEMLLGVAETIK